MLAAQDVKNKHLFLIKDSDITDIPECDQSKTNKQGSDTKQTRKSSN